MTAEEALEELAKIARGQFDDHPSRVAQRVAALKLILDYTK